MASATAEANGAAAKEKARRVCRLKLTIGGTEYGVVPVPRTKWRSWQVLCLKLVEADGTAYTVSLREAPLRGGKIGYCNCPDGLFRKNGKAPLPPGASPHCKHADTVLAVRKHVFGM